jgi:hypothetical protein
MRARQAEQAEGTEHRDASRAQVATHACGALWALAARNQTAKKRIGGGGGLQLLIFALGELSRLMGALLRRARCGRRTRPCVRSECCQHGAHTGGRGCSEVGAPLTPLAPLARCLTDAACRVPQTSFRRTRCCRSRRAALSRMPSPTTRTTSASPGAPAPSRSCLPVALPPRMLCSLECNEAPPPPPLLTAPTCHLSPNSPPAARVFAARRRCAGRACVRACVRTLSGVLHP